MIYAITKPRVCGVQGASAYLVENESNIERHL